MRVLSECILGFFWYLLGGGRSVENLRPLPSSKCSTWIFGCNLCCFGNISQSSINRSGTSRLAMSTSSWNSCLAFRLKLCLKRQNCCRPGQLFPRRTAAGHYFKFLALARILCWAREPPSRSLTETGTRGPCPGRISGSALRAVTVVLCCRMQLVSSSCVPVAVASQARSLVLAAVEVSAYTSI